VIDDEGTSPREQRLWGRHKEEVGGRTEYQRDLDRVIYDRYFRRLADVTQVSSGNGAVLRHNRMTHSLKVAQVGRRIVQYLKAAEESREGISAAGGIEADVVDAAGLLHDIGHPPFGHIGEDELNKFAQEHDLDDGFEGNAQTLRILLALTTHIPSSQDVQIQGLDLTRAVLATIVKYPVSRREAEEAARLSSNASRLKWGYYEPEAEVFGKFIAPFLPKGARTLEADIMDWADDITYAVHDMQDFYFDGLIPLHLLRYEKGSPVYEDEAKFFWDYASHRLDIKNLRLSEVEKAFANWARYFPLKPYDGSIEAQAGISRLASKLIAEASSTSNPVSISVRPDGQLVKDPKMIQVITAMKELTWCYVIDRPDLVSVQIGQRRKITFVAKRLLEWAEHAFTPERRLDGSLEETGPDIENAGWRQKRPLPGALRETVQSLRSARQGLGAYDGDDGKIIARATLDYVASLTESEFDDLYRRLAFGESRQSEGWSG
jgi:dGTPase